MTPDLWDLTRRIGTDDLTMAERLSLHPWERVWLKRKNPIPVGLFQQVMASLILARCARFTARPCDPR